MRTLIGAEPRIDNPFLDQVVASARRTPAVVGVLNRLTKADKRKLLQGRKANARKAARTLMSTYFGCGEEEMLP